MKNEFDELNTLLDNLFYSEQISSFQENQLKNINIILDKIKNKFYEYENLLKFFKHKYDKNSVYKDNFLEDYLNKVEENLLTEEEKHKKNKLKLIELLSSFDKKLITDVLNEIND